jgi:hypothetical protein
MSRRFPIAVWFLIPAFILLLATIGLATATESRSEFEERVESAPDRDEPSQRDGNEPTERSDSDRPESSEQEDGQGSGQESIVIQTEDGEVVVQLDENGNPVSVVTGDERAPSDSGRYLSATDDGQFIAIRVTPDGLLEPVSVDDLADDDFLLRPEGDDLVVVRPDGSQIRLSPTSRGELRGTEIAVDRSESRAEIANGRVTIESADRFGPGFQPDPEGEPLVIGVEGGSVRIELSDDGDLVAGQGAQPGAVQLEQGEPSAVRVNEDGSLDVIPLDEVDPNDTVLQPADGGFDLVRSDGTSVEFRPGGENDGITATEVSPDGQRTELEPNPDGSVTLSDGTTVGPVDFVEDGGAIERFIDQTSDLPWPWIFGAIALLVLLSGGTAYYLHRNRPTNDLDLTRFAVKGVPQDEFANFIDLLRRTDDPTRAIRLAFHAVERGMAGLPRRRAEETPFEWLGRVESVQSELAGPLTPICDLFALARFAPGQATVADRDAMITHLQELNRVATAAEREVASL